jgi:hypothetical protein
MKNFFQVRMSFPVIISIQEAEISRVSSSKSVPDKYILRSYLKNTQHKNRADDWLKLYSTSIAHMRP